MLKETGKDYMEKQNFLGMDIWPGERSINKSNVTALREKQSFLHAALSAHLFHHLLHLGELF